MTCQVCPQCSSALPSMSASSKKTLPLFQNLRKAASMLCFQRGHTCVTSTRCSLTSCQKVLKKKPKLVIGCDLLAESGLENLRSGEMSFVTFPKVAFGSLPHVQLWAVLWKLWATSSILWAARLAPSVASYFSELTRFAQCRFSSTARLGNTSAAWAYLEATVFAWLFD